MFNAASTNNVTELKRLLATGNNINSKDSRGITALMGGLLSRH
jgi:hypothetical protein